MDTKRTVGVFDSGVGGQSVANAIKKALPNIKIIVREDKEHLPYGTKTPEKLLKLVEPILQDMSEQCDVIVVACNTVSTTIINDLRRKIDVPLIAIEPMVKPAALATKSGTIAVCATPTTLASKRYKWLKSKFANGIKVVEPDCSDWSQVIENNQVDRGHIKERIEKSLDQGADVIVLGCTHYHWIEQEIKQIANGRAVVMQPEQPLIDQLKRALEKIK